MLLCILLLNCCCAPVVAAEGALRRAADQIVRCQANDGAIEMDRNSVQPAHVIPYFANLAAAGLVSAYRTTHSTVYRDAVRRWIDWYEAHLNADGTIFDYKGVPGAWEPTGDYDSTDSYAATYLTLVLEAYRSDSDRTWLRGRAVAVRKVLTAIRRVLQPNGLTIAKPTYPVMYTMDNVETLRGLRAAAVIMGLLGADQEAADLGKLASQMEKAISDDLWSPVRQCYRVEIQTDGGKEEGLSRWYPDVMANLMAIAWLPPSQTDRDLYGRLKTRFGGDIPYKIGSGDDVSRLVWWGMAAQSAGDHALSARIVARLMASMDAVVQMATPADLGHVCRLLEASAQTGSQD